MIYINLMGLVRKGASGRLERDGEHRGRELSSTRLKVDDVARGCLTRRAELVPKRAPLGYQPRHLVVGGVREPSRDSGNSPVDVARIGHPLAIGGLDS